MSSVVIRGLLVAVLGIVLLGVAPDTSSALTELGQFCATIAGFDDAIRSALTQPSGSATIIAVNSRWHSSLSGYELAGTGTVTESFLTPGTFLLVLNARHNSAVAFGGNKICSLFATLTPPSFNGPLQITCVGSGGAPFTTTGTLNSVTCTSGFSLEKNLHGVGE